ncbi:hypothetical protein EZS27_017974 [termite gut metagenome]|uniref:DUF4847 domain-containing protein n=1 Tax=termite gut metagenome TaxID=433724 RepID=A0A5J4RJA3_9ZZZZ
MKLRLLSVYILFAFASCNQTDDLNGIFTGKTWKLTEIRYDNGELCRDYWTAPSGFNQEAFDTSYKLKEVKDCFTVTFSGMGTDGKANGQYTGRATSITLSGNWYADAKSKTFQTSKQSTENDNDVLGRAFANAIKNAESYSGDYNNLTIYFKEGQVRKYLLMHILR